MKIYCETERLVMQVLSDRYASQVLTFYQDNKAHLEPWEMKRNSGFYTLDYQKMMLDAEYRLIYKGHMARYYLFLKDQPERVIGCVCANDIRHGSFANCSLGYKVHKEYCNQGYGTEAVAAFLDILFQDYELHRVEAMVHPDNSSSVRLLEKLGFVREGLAREAVNLQGRWQDMFYYGKLQSE